jgi:galactokinase/mevalonate kinase-like predicted kinase
MSFVIGGSDIPNFYHQFIGGVAGTAINKYFKVNINKKLDVGIRFDYS